jgi:malonate decarboxylase epsilon subunit
MLGKLPQCDEVHQTLDEAADCLGVAPSSLDTAQALRSTLSVQLCLLIAAVASVRMLARVGCKPDMVLGLSIGAYPAAVAAGCLCFADALRLVRLRGELMETAYPAHYGMTAVIGLSVTQVEQLVMEQTRPAEPAYVANINAPDQIVVAGHEATLGRIEVSAVTDFHARKARRITISVPSHCTLLAPQAKTMQAAFREISLLPPHCIYVSANTARAIFNKNQIADDLATNMACQVHWHDALIHTKERGARLAVEMLPGQVLTRLSCSILAGDGEAVALEQHSLTDVAALCQHNAL